MESQSALLVPLPPSNDCQVHQLQLEGVHRKEDSGWIPREPEALGSLLGCFDLNGSSNVVHKVDERDNKLGFGDPFPGVQRKTISNVDLYAVRKELYLGNKCEVDDQPSPWQNGRPVGPLPGPQSKSPCFGDGCMNELLVFHNYTALDGNTLRGRLFGSYELDANLAECSNEISYYSVTWEKEVGKGGWAFHHVLKTSKKYPWLKLYLRSDATKGFSGGYHHPTRGMTKIVVGTGSLFFIAGSHCHQPDGIIDKMQQELMTRTNGDCLRSTLGSTAFRSPDQRVSSPPYFADGGDFFWPFGSASLTPSMISLEKDDPMATENRLYLACLTLQY